MSGFYDPDAGLEGANGTRVEHATVQSPTGGSPSGVGSEGTGPTGRCEAARLVDAEPGCNCEWVRCASGHWHPARWLSLHSEIEIECKTGAVYHGWAAGVTRANNEATGELIFWIDLPGTGPRDFWSSEVSTVTPQGQVLDKEGALMMVRAALDNPSTLPRDDFAIALITGRHELVTISLRKETYPCLPQQGQAREKPRSSP